MRRSWCANCESYEAPVEAAEEAEPDGLHRYTVDVVLHAHEPHPCIICGGWRQDERHLGEMPAEIGQEIIEGLRERYGDGPCPES